MSNNAKKKPWKTQKTPTNHVLRLFEKFLKIRFSAQKCGSQHRFRTMLKYLETLRKHQRNMFWGFLRNFWKSGSRLKNPVLGPDVEQCLKNTLKHPENTNKACFEAFCEILENPVLSSKMWFSAQISNYAKIPRNTQKTPTKHVLRLFKKFLKIRLSAQKSGYRPRCRTMLKILWNTQKTPAKHVLRLFEKFLKIRFSAQKSGSWLRFRTMLKYLETLRKHQLNMFWGF